MNPMTNVKYTADNGYIASISDSAPIRVLHVLSSLSVRNGMLSVVESYHKYLDPSKVVFDYVYFFDLPDNRKKEIESCGSRTFFLPFQEARNPFACIDRFFLEHAGEFDVLHCHPPFAPQLFGKAARRHGVKGVIAHSHSTRFSDKHFSALRNRVLSQFLGFFATDYMTCSDAARVLLGRHGADAFLLRNAIECDRFAFDSSVRSATRENLGVDDGCILLGSVGRLAPEKNQSFMIDVLAELYSRGCECMLAIAGSGDLEAALRVHASEKGVSSRVLLLGNRTDTPALYAAFDVYLLTSLFEGLPISLIEAQASGLPCLVSDAITDEAFIANVRSMALNEGPGAWADAAIAIRQEAEKAASKRSQAADLVKQSHYDVAQETFRLEGFYFDIVSSAMSTPCKRGE